MIRFQLYELVLTTVLVATVAGCGGGHNRQDEALNALKKQVTQLKAENVNLQSRTKALDDELMVYRKKQQPKKIADGASRGKTVRLSPSFNGTIGQSRPVQIISFAGLEGGELDAVRPEQPKNNSPVESASDGKRPILRLVGNAVVVNNSGKNSVPASLARRSPAVPTVGRGDNLGVLLEERTLNASATATGEDPMELFHSAYRAYNNHEYGAALAGFSSFLRQQGAHPYADNALFWRGECYFATGQMMLAVGEFERLIRRYPHSEKAPSSLYRIGYIYEQLKDGAKAEEYYFKVVERYPGTDAARKASRRMSTGRLDAGLVRTAAGR